MTELLGKPLTFGDVEQIKELKRLEKDAERQQKLKDYKCDDCDGKGEIEEECIECEGSGYVQDACSSCDGEGFIEPEPGNK